MINKEDVCLVLYDNSYNDSIEISISSLNNKIIYYDNLSFKDELYDLEINIESDEAYYIGDLNRKKLKRHLEEKGFKVIFGENY